MSLSEFSETHKSSLSKSDMEKKIDEIREWIEKQKKISSEKAKKHIENVGKVITATTNCVQKLQSGDVLNGTLDIVSSAAVIAGEAIGGPAGAAVGVVIGAICSIIGAIFGANKPKQPSIVEQLAEVVHKELVDFNKKLQDQKYDGLKRRVADQTAQLQTMKKGDKLDDPNLWNDYVQFKGELGHRVQSPLPFKYGHHLTKDPDVADFVTAVMSYCQAYSCFMVLLLTAKGTFEHLGRKCKEEEHAVDRKISSQMQDAKDKLAFLFNEKYLTFLGRLPSEGGKLTKIVVFTRNTEARQLVKMVTSGFGLPEMLDSKTVESKAEVVSRQSVKLKLKGHPDLLHYYGDYIQFINETKFPSKIICGSVGKYIRQEKFTEAVKPRSSYEMQTAQEMFSAGGYILIYLDGKVRPDDEPHIGVTRVIEIALSYPKSGSSKVNIQDKTGSEFTRGQDTYDKMKDNEPKTIYWMTYGTHYLGSAEYKTHKADGTQQLWRFVIEDFDPIHDVVTHDK